MSFFHNLNKTLDGIAARPESAPLNERDMSRAAKGYEKYGEPGMRELSRLGQQGASEEKMDAARKKYNKYDNKEVDEGLGDMARKVGGMAKKASSAVLNKVGHGDDVDMIRDLQRKMGVAPTGKKPEQKTTEADKSDAVEDEKERLAKQIYDLGFNIHQNDGYGQDTSQEQAMLAKLKAEFARLHPGEDAFKIGKDLNDREYQQRQQQRNAEFQQNQQAKSRSTSIMQKAKNALGGMF